MLTELLGKGGCFCQPAREGRLRCPLNVRATSEDVLGGNLFQVLRVLDPYRWLPDFLATALNSPHIHRQIYRQLKIELWQNKSPYPRSLLPWKEGSSQVDATITWENPPTTVYVETKFGSDFSSKVSRDDGHRGYPSDQLIRNARVGLLECGYFQFDQLFTSKPRDFMLIGISPEKGHPLVTRYRDPTMLRTAIPHSDKLRCLPKVPFIGELSYGDIINILRRQHQWFSRAERSLLCTLIDYLSLKVKGERIVVTRRRWTGGEIEELAHRYPIEGLTNLPGLLGRSPDSVSSMAKRLGLRSVNRYRIMVRARLRPLRSPRPSQTSRNKPAG